MRKQYIKFILAAGLLAGGAFTSCNKDKVFSPTDQLSATDVYSTADGYTKAAAKVYAAFALTGNNGPAGSGDVAGVDEGSSDFFRLLWCAQELPTDEAVVGWNDVGLPDFHNMNWSSSNGFLRGLYYRSLYQITLTNEFIRQASDANLSSRGISGDDATKIRNFRNEARFLRAYQYWVLMDLFGNPPFATEADQIGSFTPQQISRSDLYKYIVGELRDIEGTLAAPRQNEYGRADQAAAWALLARVYLNAGIYTGTPDYSNAIAYAQKVIGAGYTLTGNYTNLMLADNQNSRNEFILTINYDGTKTQNFGGATFLTHAPVGGSMSPNDFGITGGWAGLRTTKALVNLFPANNNTSFPNNGNPDKRAEFWTQGQNLEINDISVFNDGYAVTKFRNVNSSGVRGSSLDYADVDVPLFRLPEMYLIYAEAVLRGGTGGDVNTALNYINALRTRAYGNTSGNISVASLTTDFVLSERGRELYWEGFRRTDLVRYGRFTDASYLWPFKGGVKNGTGVAAYRNVYPLPTTDLNVNPNLKQNTGY